MKETVTAAIHAICHSKIHSVFSEAELRDHYHTFENLLTHDAISAFVRWVARKSPDIHDGSRMSKRHPKSRRR